MGEMQAQGELLPGTLDMLVLKALAREAMHGYGVAQFIQEASGSAFEEFIGLERVHEAGGDQVEDLVEQPISLPIRPALEHGPADHGGKQQ